MGVPWNGTICGIRAQANPLVTGSTQDTIGLELGDVGVCTQVINTLFFRSLSTASLWWWICKGFCCALWSIDHWLWN